MPTTHSTAEFAGQVALVTGGGRGIGRACCVRLAEGGARVALTYVANAEAAQATKNTIEAAGGACLAIHADTGDPDEMARTVETVRSAFGPISLLVANAGTTKPRGHDQLTIEDWRETMRVNLDGPFLTIQQVKAGMIERGAGSIVCLSSIAALRPRSRQIDYSAAKGGVVAMARCFAEALAPTIRVNAIAPGLTTTDMLNSLDQSILPGRIDATPLERLGTAQEVAEAVAFLLSDRAAFITGHTLVVSGGAVMEP